MATMPATIPLTCPECGARVQCAITDDTGGVSITEQFIQTLVISVNIQPMYDHIVEHHKEKS